MKRVPILVLAIPVVIAALACNTLARPVATATPPASPIPTQPPTVAPTPTAPPTQTPAPTDTAEPSPVPTDTAAPTLVPSPTQLAFPTMNPTTRALLGPMADLMNISQYFNPVGTPVTTWNGVPIMPQATTGQAYSADIYSFKATATLAEAAKFYQAPARAMGILNGPGSGSAGTGSGATHNVVYLNFQGVIAIYSYDSDPQVVMVVIDKAP